MPSEQEDARARQLEALRQYVADLGTRRERPTELGMGRERLASRPSPRWLLLTGLLVAVALVAGVFLGAAGWSDERPASREAPASGVSSGTQAPEASTDAAVATPACKTAVDLANAMLANAVRVRGALAEHARILDDPASRSLSGRELVERLRPSQQVVAAAAGSFDRTLAEYRQVVDRCDLRAP